MLSLWKQNSKERDAPCYDLTHDSDFVCSVCVDIFTEPKTLSCGHSFCSVCLDKLIINQTRQTHYITCPNCRKRHSKVMLSLLKMNKTLIEAAAAINKLNHVELEGEETVDTRSEVILYRLLCQLTDDNIIFHKQITSASAMPKNKICFSTTQHVYCYLLDMMRGPTLLWKQGFDNVHSICSANKHIYVLQKLNKILWTGDFYTCWKISVLDLNGKWQEDIHAGLGEECSLSALDPITIAVCDSGSHKLHAQPCLIVINTASKSRQLLMTKTRKERLIKPQCAIEWRLKNQYLIYDSGRKELNLYTASPSTSSLELLQTLKIKKFKAMTSTHNMLLIATAGSLIQMSPEGEIVSENNVKFGERIGSMSSCDGIVAVAVDQTCLVYDIKSKDCFI